MKTIVCRSMAAALLCVFALGVSAQDVLKVKVMNIPSAVGKIMIATDKGQYGMVDAKGTEAVTGRKKGEGGGIWRDRQTTSKIYRHLWWWFRKCRTHTTIQRFG